MINIQRFKIKKSFYGMSSSLSAWIFTSIFVLSETIDFIPSFSSYLPLEWTKWVAIASLAAKIVQKGIDKS
jgi:hypothetical protein